MFFCILRARPSLEEDEVERVAEEDEDCKDAGIILLDLPSLGLRKLAAMLSHTAAMARRRELPRRFDSGCCASAR